MLNLIDHLPAYSHYGHALSQDERLAEQMATDAKPRPPTLPEYGPDVQAIAGVYDRLGTVIALLRAGNGEKGVRVGTPYPRPRFAAERIRRRRHREKHDFIKAQLLPDR